jgi:alkanesulfonate monooxygenase SsuD/methylene tetrahydromethanopterin reductase-like flavin-dependent oxidoreductase (luciferase family)
MAGRPGPLGFRMSVGQASALDWPTMAACWTLAGETRLFDAGWLSDHLTDASRDRGGAAFESMTALAALATRVPGMWVGVAVASNTFRHPAVLAKSAAMLDNVTGGRFILGLGAGWHEGEHDQFGIPLPPMAERFDRFQSAVELAARLADGWPMPGNRPGDVAFFSEMRDRIRTAVEAAGRDPDDFTFAAQMTVGAGDGELREARETAAALLRAGAHHLIIGVPAPLGPNGVARMASEVAAPIRDSLG